MFTGIVREIGTVAEISDDDDGARLRIETAFAGVLAEGDSISVEGVCLTATDVGAEDFAADVMNQTLGLTTLGGLEAGSPVNLEPALRAGEPLGGHIVQGHVDAVGLVHSVAEDGFARRVAVSAPRELAPYLVEHGSITVAGVSLTVAGLGDDGVFEVSLIPETLERTTLGGLRAGDRVNLEMDVLARYVERLLRFQQKESS